MYAKWIYIYIYVGQPYTAGGKRLDDLDKRAAGLLHIIKNILPNLSKSPKFIFLENVPNFETSNSRDLLIDVLNSLGYVIDEFLISPLSIGIPNNRKRYYLAAYLPQDEDNSDNAENGENDHSTIHSKPRPKRQPYPKDDPSLIHRTPQSYCTFLPPIKSITLDPLSLYINPTLLSPTAIASQNLQVKEGDIRKRTNFIFDCVTASAAYTSTFTKAYGTHHFFGSGSLLQTQNLDNPYGDSSSQEELIAGRPRFFSPQEVALLHGFPDKEGGYRGILSFTNLHDHDHHSKEDDEQDTDSKHVLQFPPHTSYKQRWQLLGNSLNVSLVAALLTQLLGNHKK